MWHRLCQVSRVFAIPINRIFYAVDNILFANESSVMTVYFEPMAVCFREPYILPSNRFLRCKYYYPKNFRNKHSDAIHRLILT